MASVSPVKASLSRGSTNKRRISETKLLLECWPPLVNLLLWNARSGSFLVFHSSDPASGRGGSLHIKHLRQLPGALTVRLDIWYLLGEHGLD